MLRTVSYCRVNFPRFSFLALVGLLALPCFGDESLAEKLLRETVAREREFLARAEKDGEHLDEAKFAGDAKAIASSYDVLIQKNPDFAPAFVAYGLFLGKLDMNRAAVAMLLRANKLDPHIPLVKNQLAKHLAEDGKPVDALPYLLSAIDLAPNEPLYHLHFGLLLMEARADFLQTGDWTRVALDQAVLDSLQRAAELTKGDFSYAYQHAKAFYEIAPPRWEEALKVWERLGDRATTTATRQLVKLHRANVLAQLERSDEARALLTQVTEPQFDAEKKQVLEALAAKEKKP